VLAIHAEDAKSAERLMEMDRLADEIQRKHALEAGQMLAQSEDPIQQAFGKYLERVSKMDIPSNRFERQGENLVLFQMAAQDHSPKAQMLVLAVGGILVALLLPAIQAAREAARRAQSMNNLKQLMLGMLIYSDAHKVLPPHASYSPDGKPLLSWRVHILPYMEENALYQQFHLDEPWDSPHNRTLIEKMPAVFDNPNIDEPGKTNYLALVGPECVMDGTAEGIGFAKISDGTSKTIVLVEADADRAIEWTRPDDIKFDAKDPHAGFGKLRPGGSNAAFCDGHIQFISADIDPGLMKALITRNGRETVDVP
jgi:prepilin-type processing-associated H-X9-DG protein